MAEEITLEQEVDEVLGSAQTAEADVLVEEEIVEASLDEPEDDEDEGSDEEDDADDDAE